MKRREISSNFRSGCSYISHMILAASMGEPPPRAMNMSGWKARMELSGWKARMESSAA